MATFGGANIVTDNLVLWLDAANRRSYPGSGATWTDMSGNGNNGTLTNGPTFSSANNGSIVFDAVDDYISLGNASVYNITSTNAYTINVWFYNDYPNLGKALLHKGIITGVDYDYMIYISGDSGAQASRSISFYKKNSSGTGVATNSIVIEPYRIYNYSVTLNSNNVVEYINGVFQQTTVFSGDIRSTSNPLKIGRGWNGTIAGKVYNTQIYNRALSASEVQQNYEALKSRYLNQY